MIFKVLYKISGIIAISLITNDFALAKSKEFPYLRDGISFSLSDDWKITSNDSIGNNAWYFSAERIGPKSTGLITITWINKVEDPKETITLHQRTMKSANIYRNPGIEFTLVGEENFAGQKAESCRYSTIVKDQKLEGVIYCLNSSQKTITIFFQSGPDDTKLNQKAFELIQQTFNCRDK